MGACKQINSVGSLRFKANEIRVDRSTCVPIKDTARVVRPASDLAASAVSIGRHRPRARGAYCSRFHTLQTPDPSAAASSPVRFGRPALPFVCARRRTRRLSSRLSSPSAGLLDPPAIPTPARAKPNLGGKRMRSPEWNQRRLRSNEMAQCDFLYHPFAVWSYFVGLAISPSIRCGAMASIFC